VCARPVRSDRVRRRRPPDRALLFLGLFWLLCFGLSLHSVLNETGYPSVLLSAASERDGYPIVVGIIPETSAGSAGLALGDRLLEVGGRDLRGRGHLALYAPFARVPRVAGGARTIPARFAHEGVVHEAPLPVGSYQMYWPRLPASLVFALAAGLLIRRARESRMARAFAQTFLVAACFLACTFGGKENLTAFAIAVHLASVALVIPLSLRAALLFPDGESPKTGLGWLGPWAFAVLGVFEASRFYEHPFSRGVGVMGMTLGDLAFFLLLLGIATRAYRRADPVGRRQMKWVLLGVYLALVLPIATTVTAAGNVELIPIVVISMASLALIPISVVIAIARYNLFDIDRLLSSTASYTLIGSVLVAGVLAAVPPAAHALSAEAGIQPTTAQLGLSLLLAAILVPSQVWLGPRIERFFFPERHALVQGVEALLENLRSCTSPRDIAQLAGESLDAMLRPESCAIYARDSQGFSPIFVRGRIVPPAFPASSPLVRALEERGRPLSPDRLPLGRKPDLSPIDRAALETLGVPVVVPVRFGKALVAFMCLGSKRSGDVYTSTDSALLAAVADKLSGELERFDQAEVIREAREMQETLRRYVPGALADELTKGRAPEVGRREVSVLFVDIRGYSTYAESRSASEIFSTVNRYTRCVSEIVIAHGGSVVEFNGDGMMAIFGAPHAMAWKERAATEAGREIVRSVAALSLEGGGLIAVGVGVATGEAFVGNIQAADRLIWSAIGNTTNLAARLQTMTRELDAAMVIDAVTFGRAGEAAPGFRKHAAATIAGRRKTEDIYALPLASSQITPDRFAVAPGPPQSNRLN